MYHVILVPLDGSSLGEHVLPLAAAIAQMSGARLVLVRAVQTARPLNLTLTEGQRRGIGEEDLNLTTDPWGAERTDVEVQAVAEADTYLAGVSAPLIAAGLAVELASPFGPTAQCILDEIALRQADLVIMSTHGRSGLGRVLYGSVAEAVLARSPVPVLLMRSHAPQAAFPAASVTRGERLLVPLDGSALSEAALPHAETLARMLGGALALLHVASPPVLPYTDLRVVQDGQDEIIAHLLEQEQARAQDYLDKVAARLRQSGLQVQTVVCAGMPADEIKTQAQALAARVIVIATHGRTGLRRLLMGSVAMQVVRDSQLPVLLVRPPAATPHTPDVATP